MVGTPSSGLPLESAAVVPVNDGHDATARSDSTKSSPAVDQNGAMTLPTSTNHRAASRGESHRVPASPMYVISGVVGFKIAAGLKQQGVATVTALQALTRSVVPRYRGALGHPHRAGRHRECENAPRVLAA